MEYTIKYVGLDVAKDSIAVAVADEGREAPRYLGKIPHDLTALRKLLGRLGEPEMLEACLFLYGKMRKRMKNMKLLDRSRSYQSSKSLIFRTLFILM